MFTFLRPPHLIGRQFSDNQNRDSSSWLCPGRYLNYWIQDQGDRSKNEKFGAFFLFMPLSITIHQHQQYLFKSSLSQHHNIIVILTFYSSPFRCRCHQDISSSGSKGMAWHTQVVGKRSSRSLGLTRCYDDTWSSNAWPMTPLMIQYDTSCLHIADVVIRFKTKVNTQMDVHQELPSVHIYDASQCHE